MLRPPISTYGPALVIDALSATLFSMKCGVQKGALRKVALNGTPAERALAIARCISPDRMTGPEFLPACAFGHSNSEASDLTLPSLCAAVFDETASKLAPIFDIESCIAWGHFVSLRGCLEPGSPPTLILTQGDEVHESYWLHGKVGTTQILERGQSRDKQPRHDALGTEYISVILSAIVRKRQAGAERVVLDSGLRELVATQIDAFESLAGLKIEWTDLPEAAAIGARVMTALAQGQLPPRAL